VQLLQYDKSYCTCKQWRNPGGQSLAEGSPLVTVGGPTSQNSEKG